MQDCYIEVGVFPDAVLVLQMHIFIKVVALL